MEKHCKGYYDLIKKEMVPCKSFTNLTESGYSQYKVSRNNRINELVSNLKEQEVQEIEESIPKETPHLDYGLFKKLYNECIDKIIYGDFQMPRKPFGIMLNIYEDKFCVFEVWNIERSISKDIELDR